MVKTATRSKAEIVATLFQRKIVALVRGEDHALLVKAILAAAEGGISCIEVTWTVPNAAALLKSVKKQLPSTALVGAGTIVNVKQFDEAIDANADFVVGPSTDVVDFRLGTSVVRIPGAMTPSEVVRSIEGGADIVKIFPAGYLGADYIKHLRGPLPDVPLLAAGGITVENGRDFFSAGVRMIAVGGELFNKELIRSENWKAIAENARGFVKLVQSISGETA